MIVKDKKEVTQVCLCDKIISAIYRGKTLVWQSVRSCFGSGKWVNEKPFINNEPWKN